MRQQVTRAEHDAPVERLLPAVEPAKHERRREQLEGAAHQEALIGAVAEQRAGGGFENVHAEPAEAGAFDDCEAR